MLKAILIDDEPKALESLSWELDNFSDEIEILAKFTDPEEALIYIEKVSCDCLFLDIEMPTMDGFQFLNRLKTKDFAVIITTAYNEYAIKALKEEAIDYLLKPIDMDDLKVAISKVKKYISRNDVSTEKFERILSDYNSRFNKKRITINTDGKLIFLDLDELLFAESDGNYSTLYLTNSKKIVLTKKLKEVNAMLPDERFFRIHNSYIVNLDKIKEFIKADGYVILVSNHKIPISRQRKAAFLEKL
ncbi:LytTR family two component transcriptional regulator [Kordia periserrulae]|uniref:LytTR family two component transcriptional regulator n=1 Tax=Kordia periserrulae TaxID=701523 RepID=A0A2T6BXQ4_9FLAO|nr:LytTR family DNA-binding domain-containing protein [Kordia periserrulae]PTX60850.1 LytTR family two component transcriptional regulator [Kordia periserrulae]